MPVCKKEKNEALRHVPATRQNLWNACHIIGYIEEEKATTTQHMPMMWAISNCCNLLLLEKSILLKWPAAVNSCPDINYGQFPLTSWMNREDQFKNHPVEGKKIWTTDFNKGFPLYTSWFMNILFLVFKRRMLTCCYKQAWGFKTKLTFCNTSRRISSSIQPCQTGWVQRAKRLPILMHSSDKGSRGSWTLIPQNNSDLASLPRQSRNLEHCPLNA